MMWSSTSIPGKPTILMVDGSGNRDGWEEEFCDRLFASMRKRQLSLVGDGPVRVLSPGELASHLAASESFNCLLLLAHGTGDQAAPHARFGAYWEAFRDQSARPDVLLGGCMWESYDTEVAQSILKSSDGFPCLAVVQESDLTPRAASLFLLKFFAELDLHSSEAITGRMVWFSWSKAKEILRRRRLEGKMGVRC